MNDIRNISKNVWLGLYTVAVGMKITFLTCFQSRYNPVSDERLQLPERERNRLL